MSKPSKIRTTVSLFLWRFALCVVFATALAMPTRADSTYTYTGNPLTLEPSPGHEFACSLGPTPCGPLVIDFTVPQPLGPNLFDAHISPTSFAVLFDEVETDTLDPNLSGGFVITTDSSGNITNWSVNVTDQLTSVFSEIYFTNNGEDFVEFFEAGFGALELADNSGMPGTWTMSTTGGTGGTGGSGGMGGGTSVPEPSSLALLGGGVLGLVSMGLRKRAGC